MNKVLEVKNLTKKFKNFIAVDNLSFSIEDGEILGLLGPNGAGKTTTIQMLLGVMEPTYGEITYFDKPFKKYREQILKDVNFSSGYISLPWLLTIEEIMDVFARLYEVPNRKERIQKLVVIFEIEPLMKKQFYQLSAGEKSRVLLVKAFLNYPKLILLDEPTASLDPDVAKKVREFLVKEKKEFNVSMLFTSHNMAEVEEVCDRVIFINHGKIVAMGTPQEIAKNIKECTLQLMIVKEDIEKALNFIKSQDLEVKKDKFYLKLRIAESKIAKFLSDLTRKKINFEEISIEKPNLEDFFLKIYGEDKND